MIYSSTVSAVNRHNLFSFSLKLYYAVIENNCFQKNMSTSSHPKECMHRPFTIQHNKHDDQLKMQNTNENVLFFME